MKFYTLAVLHILPFCSCMMSSQFEAYVSAKFPSDGKYGTSGILNAAFGRKVKVIKHDSYLGYAFVDVFGLEICI